MRFVPTVYSQRLKSQYTVGAQIFEADAVILMKDVAWCEGVSVPEFASMRTRAGEKFDLAIVGGGLAGISAARGAAEQGLSTVLLEANTVGSGASGRNAGFVVPHYPGVSPASVEQLLGHKKGAELNALVAAGAGEVFYQIREHGIECEAVQKGWMQAAHSPRSSQTVQRMLRDWKSYGANVVHLSREDVAQRMGTREYADGWLVPSGGYVNPYALTVGLAVVAAAAGVQIVENANVSAMSKDAAGFVLHVGEDQLHAKKVLVATNGYTGSQWGALSRAAVPVRLYTTLSRPLTSNLRQQILPARPCVSDLHAAPRFSRLDEQGRLVAAGMASLFGDRRRKALCSAEQAIAEVFPELGEQAVDRYWEGFCAMSRTGIPSLYRLDEGAYAISGFSGRGVSLAHALGPVLGGLMSESIGPHDVPLDVVSPRADPWFGIKRFSAPIAYKLLKQVDRFKLS